jgi:hypothetical protein
MRGRGTEREGWGGRERERKRLFRYLIFMSFSFWFPETVKILEIDRILLFAVKLVLFNMFLFYFVCLFVVKLGFKPGASSYSTSPFFLKSFFKIGS